MLVVDVLRRLDRCDRPVEVLDLVVHFAAPRGYEAVAIGAPHRKNTFNGHFHSNWPSAWVEAYIAQGFFADDPLPRAAALNTMPVRWSDILAGRAGFAPTSAQRRVLEAGATHGYRDGVCVPVHGPGAYAGIGSYAGLAPDTSDEVLDELHLLTLHADSRFTALGARGAGSSASDAPLTPREIEALRGVLVGSSDAAIALTMGVTERTARFHIDNARSKLGARTRAQAVAAALALGLLAG
jgi:LuxR family quorum sensing-dependent transcriptional regulator